MSSPSSTPSSEYSTSSEDLGFSSFASDTSWSSMSGLLATPSTQKSLGQPTRAEEVKKSNAYNQQAWAAEYRHKINPYPEKAGIDSFIEVVIPSSKEFIKDPERTKDIFSAMPGLGPEYMMYEPLTNGLNELGKILPEGKQMNFYNNAAEQIPFPYPSRASLSHPTKPDVVGYLPGHVMGDNEKPQWRHIALAIECKPKASDDPVGPSKTQDHRDALIQLIKSARNMLVGRVALNAYVIGIYRDIVRVFFVDRAAAIASPPFSLTKNPEIFHKLLWHLVHPCAGTNLDSLDPAAHFHGSDPTVSLPTPEDIEWAKGKLGPTLSASDIKDLEVMSRWVAVDVEDESGKITSDHVLTTQLLFINPCLFSRATTVWITLCKSDGQRYPLKDSWRQLVRMSELDHYRFLQNALANAEGGMSGLSELKAGVDLGMKEYDKYRRPDEGSPHAVLYIPDQDDPSGLLEGAEFETSEQELHQRDNDDDGQSWMPAPEGPPETVIAESTTAGSVASSDSADFVSEASRGETPDDALPSVPLSPAGGSFSISIGASAEVAVAQSAARIDDPLPAAGDHDHSAVSAPHTPPHTSVENTTAQSGASEDDSLPAVQQVDHPTDPAPHTPSRTGLGPDTGSTQAKKESEGHLSTVIPYLENMKEAVGHCTKGAIVRDPSNAMYRDRSHIRLLMKKLGIPVWRYRQSKKAVLAIYGSILGHQKAFNAGLLHRDVSEGNVMMTDGNPDEPATCGFLTDFDYSSLDPKAWDQSGLTDEDRKKLKERTGTLAFMAIELLQTNLGTHEPRHDLESDFWLLLSLILRYAKHNDEQGKYAYSYYLGPGSIKDCQGRKRNFLTDCSMTPLVIEGNEPLTTLINKFASLVRKAYYWGFDEVPVVPLTYEAVIAIFKEAVEKDTWPEDDAAIPYTPPRNNEITHMDPVHVAEIQEQKEEAAKAKKADLKAAKAAKKKAASRGGASGSKRSRGGSRGGSESSRPGVRLSTATSAEPSTASESSRAGSKRGLEQVEGSSEQQPQRRSKRVKSGNAPA